MRNRAGTSNINRRKYIKKASSSQSSSQPSSQPANKIVPASNTVSSAGIVVAAPGAAERVQGKEPVSTNLIGQELKVDDEGRQDITHLQSKPEDGLGSYLIKQAQGFLTGAPVATSQMVGSVKNLAYGVDAKDQVVEESGLDLLINPIIKPYVDPRMKTEGVISDEWYWPEELKADSNILPPFMQKSDTIEKRSLIEGISANLGNIGAISQAPLAGAIRDEEFAVSGERFMSAPGYYIGTAAGEIPYFLIGVGQVKSVATIAAKGTAGVIRGSVKGTAGVKLVAEAYKMEQATTKLQKATNLDNKLALTQATTTSGKAVDKAVATLKKGYDININIQKKALIKFEETKNTQKLTKVEAKTLDDNIQKAKDLIAKETMESKQLTVKYGSSAKKAISEEKDELVRRSKADDFNALIQSDLLPQLRTFKDEYVAQTVYEGLGSKANRFANIIEGSPQDVSQSIDRFLNRPGRAMGDSLTKQADQIFRERIMRRKAEGKYAGVMGKVILDKDIWGNVATTALGIDRATGKMTKYAELVSRTVPGIRVISADNYLKLDKAIDKKIEGLVDENTFLKTQRTSMDEELDELSGAPYKRVSEVRKEKSDVSAKIAKNNEQIKKLRSDKRTVFSPLDYTPSIGKNVEGKGKYKGKTTDYTFNFSKIIESFPELKDVIANQKINVGAQPSVSIRKVNGVVMGQVGDTPKTSMTFWIQKMPRSEAISEFGEWNISKKKNWVRNLGLRKVGKFRTTIPKRYEGKEEVIYFYKADDSLRSTSGKKSGVDNIISIGKDAPEEEVKQFMSSLYLEKVDPNSVLAKTMPERQLFRYRRIKQEDIATVIEGTRDYKVDIKVNVNQEGSLKAPNQQYVSDILKARSIAEKRPDDAKMFAKREIELIDMQQDQMRKNYAADYIQPVHKNTPWGNRKKMDAAQELTSSMRELDLRKVQLRKWNNPSKVSSLQKKLGIMEQSNPRGEIISMPLEKLKKESELLGRMNESDMFIDNRTKQLYYRSGKRVFKVTDDSFNPQKVSTSDRVVQSTEYKGFVNKDTKTGESNWYSESTNLIPTGSIAKYNEFKESLTSDTIFISKNKTELRGKLEELTPKQIDQLKSGSNLGSLLSKQKGELASIDQATPKMQLIDPVSGLTILSKKTKTQLVDENIRVVKGKVKVRATQTTADAKTRLGKILLGDRFSPVNTENFTPDSMTFANRGETIIGNLIKGTSERNVGYDTSIRALFGVGDDPALTQGAIPSGVKVNPIYDQMSTAHVVIDKTSDVPGKGMQANKDTIYSRLVREASRPERNELYGFKRKMTQLVRTNIEKQPKYSDKELNAIVDNDTLYNQLVADKLDTVNNEYLRPLKKGEAEILKGKNQKKKDKLQVIDPKTNFPGYNVVDTAGPVKRVYRTLKGQTIYTAPESMGKVVPDTAPVTFMGKPLPGPNFINRIFRTTSRKLDRKDKLKKPTEFQLDFQPEAFRSIMERPEFRGFLKTRKGKRFAKSLEYTQGAAPTAQRRALESMIKNEENPGGWVETVTQHASKYTPGVFKVLEDGTALDKFGKEVYFTPRVSEFNTMKEKVVLSGRAFRELKKADGDGVMPIIDEATGTYIGKDIEVELRGRIAEVKETTSGGTELRNISTIRPTAEITTAALEGILYKAAGLPIDFSTSLSRSANTKAILTKIDVGYSKAKAGGIVGKKGDPLENIKQFLEETKEGQALLESPGLKPNIAQQQQATKSMSGVSDRTAQRTDTGRVFGFSAETLFKPEKQESSIGFRQQLATGAKATSTTGTNIGTRTTVLQPQDTQSEPISFNLLPEASAEPFIVPPQPKNIIDQTIGDIQKTMSGVIEGNKNIGKGSDGVGVRTYEMSQNLNIFDTSSRQSQNQVPNLLEGLRLDSQEKYETVVIPQIDNVFDATIGQAIKQKAKPVNTFMQGTIADKQLVTTPSYVTPKPVPQRVMPIVPLFPMFDPVEAAKQRRSKIKKKKTKKTWWQTPENWYEPYYWGGKDQMGAGYVTFTGKEPGKVRKYEKRFFGIGVNDSPFGVRSKWF